MIQFEHKKDWGKVVYDSEINMTALQAQQTTYHIKTIGLYETLLKL